MDVRFNKSGGPFSDDPPVGNAFVVNRLDVDSKIYEISESAFDLLKAHGAYKFNRNEKQDAPYVEDKKLAESKSGKKTKKK